jgi:transcriptional regulator with XRE-family HTH domain
VARDRLYIDHAASHTRVLKIEHAHRDIENGKRNPTPATIKQLADATGVSADGLLKSS